MKSFIARISAVLLLCCGQTLWAQKLPDIIPFQENNLYGYCDSNMNVLIEAQYKNIHPFYDDRAVVVVDGLSGFIDRKGNQVIPCIYKYVTRFSHGCAMVGSSRFEAKPIDVNGNFLSRGSCISMPPPKIAGTSNRVGKIKEGRYFYRGPNGKEGYVSVDGDTISTSDAFSYPYYSESYSTADDYDQYYFRHFYESRAIVSGTNGQGYINLNGQLVIDTVFDVAFNFKKGRAKVKVNGKYGFIDTLGNPIGAIKYDQACYFYDGMAQVVIDDKCGYINRDGEEIVPIVYDYWQGEKYAPYKNGLVRVRIDDKFGILDKNGNKVTEVKYDAISPFYHKRAIVVLNDLVGVIDEQGNEIIPPVYARLTRMDAFAFLIQKDPNERLYEIINMDGTLILPETENRPATEEGFGSGLYKIYTDTHGMYFMDWHGTKYLR